MSTPRRRKRDENPRRLLSIVATDYLVKIDLQAGHRDALFSRRGRHESRKAAQTLFVLPRSVPTRTRNAPWPSSRAKAEFGDAAAQLSLSSNAAPVVKIISMRPHRRTSFGALASKQVEFRQLLALFRRRHKGRRRG